MLKWNVVKIPPITPSLVSCMCISIDHVGLLPREGGRAGAGPFDLVQYCYDPGKGWREAALWIKNIIKTTFPQMII